jgi:hypothetical protein
VVVKPRDRGQSVHASIEQLIARYRARAGGVAPIVLGGDEEWDAPSRPYAPGSRVLIAAGVLAAPFACAGYVGITMVLVLPLLALRAMFPRTPPTGPWYDGAGRDRR